jgi:hypothetical protein
MILLVLDNNNNKSTNRSHYFEGATDFALQEDHARGENRNTPTNMTTAEAATSSSSISSLPSFEFRWFDFAAATEAQRLEIQHVYTYVFKHDIDIDFDPQLDSDFMNPLTYYASAARGAYGVVVQTGGSPHATGEEVIVGTVGFRGISIPESCYTGVGATHLPPKPAARRRADGEGEIDGVAMNLSGDDCVPAALHDYNVCELKRMFLLPCARGKGLSKVMLDNVTQKARELGYAAMVLDTRKRLEAANRLYEVMGGFVEFSDYNGNPRPDRFMIRKL